MSDAATAITIFHRAADPEQFDAWANDYVACARQSEGFTGSRVSVHREIFDSGVEVTFRTADQLDEWLDGSARRALLRGGEAIGHWRRAADLVFTANHLPDGVAIFMHSVAPGKEAEFAAIQNHLASLTTQFSGNEGTVWFPPDSSGEWKSVLRFRTADQLLTWLRSPERAAALPAVRENLSRSFSELRRNAPFGSVVRTDYGETRITPGWKTAMVVFLCLYPTTMLLSRFLGPELSHFGFARWLVVFISNITSVVLLQWVLVPRTSQAFRRWLDPIDGAGLRTSLIGAAVIGLSYAVMLVIFGSVTWLHY